MFGRSISLFSIAGFTVKIDWTWAFLAILIAWSLAMGYFPVLYEGLPATTYWAMGLAGLLGLAASIVLHELAHSLVARRYGLHIRGITLFIFGGVAEMPEEPSHPKGEFLMAIAGPIASAVLAALFWAGAEAAANLGGAAPVVGVLRYLAYLNGLIAIFNLIPAFPLDGGRILRSALWWGTGDMRRATRISSRAGMGLGIGLMILGVLSVVTGAFVQGLWWLLLGMFIQSAARSAEFQGTMRDVLKGEPVARFMTPEPVTVPPDRSLRDLIDHYIYQHPHSVYPVVEEDRLLGWVSVRDVRAAGADQWEKQSVRAVLTPRSPENTVDAAEDATKALMKMQASNMSRLMVVRDDRLVGIVSINDLMKLMSFKLDLEGRRPARRTPATA